MFELKTVAEDASHIWQLDKWVSWDMALVGFPLSQPQGILGLPSSSLQILAPLLGVIGLFLGLKCLKTDSSPFQLLHVPSPEAVTETSGQGILTGLFTPSELRGMLEDSPGSKVPALPANPFRNRAGTFHLYLFL